MAKNRSNKDREKLLDEKQITRQYGLTKNQIRKYFPKPQLRTVRAKSGAWWKIAVWPEEQVRKTLANPELAQLQEERRRSREEERKIAEIREIFREYSPDSYIERGKQLKRSFVLHVGPTNSGKTYDAIEDLKANAPGTYLGPLRLVDVVEVIPAS